MEQTLGKRIAFHRKRLDLTQDALAEQLGITAQAVSKWENDLSCPDITTLPRLAEILGISIDELLGHTSTEKVHTAEVVDDDGDHGIFNISVDSKKEDGKWEFRWDNSRRSALGFACWVLLMGILLLTDNVLQLDVGFWSLAWPSFLLMLGLFGGKKFSFTHLGFIVLGAYFLVDKLGFLPFELGGQIIWPALVILFGLSLLADALRKPKKSRFYVKHNGKEVHNGPSDDTHVSSCTTEDGRFNCGQSFGENTFYICEDLLTGGEANLSFGSLTVDLTDCKAVAPHCEVEVNCSFGEVTLRLPRRFRAELSSNAAFGHVDISGNPEDQPDGIIYLDANVSFGAIDIQYI